MGMGRRRRRRLGSLLFIIFILIAIIISGIFAYIGRVNYFQGTFVRTIDITDEIIANSLIWLSDIEGYSLDKNALLSNSDSIKLDIVCDFKKNSLLEGSYTCYVDEKSYNEAVNRSKALIASALNNVIKHKLITNNYSDSITDDELNNLVNEILGCSLIEYLDKNHISVIDSYDTYKRLYNSTGSFVVSLKTLKLNDGSVDNESHYIIDNNKLIFPDEEKIYIRQVTK